MFAHGVTYSSVPTPLLCHHTSDHKLLVFPAASASLFMEPSAVWRGGLACSSSLGTEHAVHIKLMRAFLMRRSR